MPVISNWITDRANHMKHVMLGVLTTVAIVIACTVSIMYYHPSQVNTISGTTTPSNTVRKAGQVNGYHIRVYYRGKLIKELTLSDLHRLRNYVFVDSKGHEQEGPLLYDIIRYVIGNRTFNYVIVKGERGNTLENLTYAIVSNPRNYIILDYTKRGTTKLCGNENVLPRTEWVKDVTEIIIEG